MTTISKWWIDTGNILAMKKICMHEISVQNILQVKAISVNFIYASHHGWQDIAHFLSPTPPPLVLRIQEISADSIETVPNRCYDTAKMAYNTRPGNIKSPYVVVVGNSLPKWIIIVKMVATWPFFVYGVDCLMLMPNYHKN